MQRVVFDSSQMKIKNYDEIINQLVYASQNESSREVSTEKKEIKKSSAEEMNKVLSLKIIRLPAAIHYSIKWAMEDTL